MKKKLLTLVLAFSLTFSMNVFAADVQTQENESEATIQEQEENTQEKAAVEEDMTIDENEADNKQAAVTTQSITDSWESSYLNASTLKLNKTASFAYQDSGENFYKTYKIKPSSTGYYELTLKSSEGGFEDVWINLYSADANDEGDTINEACVKTNPFDESYLSDWGFIPTNPNSTVLPLKKNKTYYVCVMFLKDCTQVDCENSTYSLSYKKHSHKLMTVHDDNFKEENGEKSIWKECSYFQCTYLKAGKIEPAPKLKEIEVTRGGLKIQYSGIEIPNVDYQVQYATNSKFKNAVTRDIDDYSEIENGYVTELTCLEANKKYYIRVREYSYLTTDDFTDKDIINYSSWSNVMSAKTPQYLTSGYVEKIGRKFNLVKNKTFTYKTSYNSYGYQNGTVKVSKYKSGNSSISGYKQIKFRLYVKDTWKPSKYEIHDLCDCDDEMGGIFEYNIMDASTGKCLGSPYFWWNEYYEDDGTGDGEVEEMYKNWQDTTGVLVKDSGLHWVKKSYLKDYDGCWVLFYNSYVDVTVTYDPERYNPEDLILVAGGGSDICPGDDSYYNYFVGKTVLGESAMYDADCENLTAFMKLTK